METTLKFETVEELARVLEPFSADAATLQLGSAVFAGGRARVCDGIIGVDMPGAALDGVVLPIAALTGPALSLKSDVTFRVEKSTIHLAAGNFRGRFASIAPETMLAWPDAPSAKTFVPLGQDAWAAAQSVLFAADVGQRTALSAVKFAVGQALALSSVRLARALAKGAPDALLPSRFLTAVAKAYPDATPDAIAQDVGGRVWLRFGKTLCWSLLPSEEFPESVHKTAAEQSKRVGAGHSARWAIADATSALTRVAPFSEGRLTVKATGKRLMFRAESQRGEVEESIAAEVARPFDVDAASGLLVDAFGRADCCAVASDGTCFVFRRRGWELIIMAMVRS